MVYEGYLSFGGNEIVNSPRAYGLQLTAPCDSGWLRDPGCESLQEILGDTIYTHDNISSAPWYDPSFPESARFYGVYGLGFYGLKDSTRQVQVTEGLASGGVVGSSRKGVLPLRVRASLLAEGDDAMEYGRSWLEAALSPGACGQHGEECGTADVQFFSTCPPGRAIVKGFSDWREYARNYMQTPSFEGMEAAGEAVPVYENLFTNPSFETPSVNTIEVRRNYVRNPVNGNPVNGLAWGVNAYTVGAPNVGTYSVASGWQVAQATALAAGGRFGYRIQVPLPSVAAGVPISFRMNSAASELILPTGVRARFWVDAFAPNGSTIVGHFDDYFTASQLTLAGTITPIAEATSLMIYVWLESTTAWSGVARVGSAWGVVEVGVPSAGWPFTGGSQMVGSAGPDADLTPSWTGVAGESASILSANVPVTPIAGQGFGDDAQVFRVQSSTWSASGAKSLRLIPRSSGAYAYVFAASLTPGKTYTLLATYRQDKTQGTNPSPRARGIEYSEGGVIQGAYAANTAGVTQLRLTFTVGTGVGTRIIRFQGQARASGGFDPAEQFDSWFDNIALLEGVYSGDYFDGGRAPRVRENRAIRPVADENWAMVVIGGGTQLLSLVEDTRFGGDKARKSEVLTRGSSGYVFPGSTLNGIQVGDVWTLSMKYATVGYDGPEPSLSFGGGNPPAVTILGTGTIDHGDGTKTAWRTVQVTEARSGSTDPILTGFGSRPAGMVLLAGEALWEKAPAFTEWFSGDSPQKSGFAAAWEGAENMSRSYVFDVDFTPGWTGAAHASTSILWGQGAYPVTGIRAAVILSSRWSKSGRKSLRIISKGSPSEGANSKDTYAQVTIPAAIRGGGTLVGTSHLEEPVVDGSSLVGELMVAVPIVEVKRPNVAGDVDLRLNYGALTSSYTARFYHGGPEGSADVWWDAVGLFAGSYEGPWFDGNTEPAGDPELSRYRWVDYINFSESVYEVRERTSREQTDEEWAESVDDVRRFLHGVAAVSGPLTVSETRRDGMVRQTVEFTLEATRPWVYGVTRTVDLPRTQSSVIEDVQYNLIPYPSMEAAGGAVTIAENLATNPSVEVDATGWTYSGAPVSGSALTGFVSGARSTELAAVGSASYRVNLFGNQTSAASGRAAIQAIQDVSLPATPARARFSFNIWAALIKSAGSAATVLHTLDARVDWINSSNGFISMTSLGTATSLGGFVFSARSVLPPGGAVKARVIVRGEVTWESSATPANNSDIRLYADALAVTIP